MTLPRRHIASLAAVALVAGSIVVTGGASAALADDAVAGGQSSGDSLFPNQGNTGYDAVHYDIDLSVDVAISTTNNRASTTTFPAAQAAITAVTTGAPLSSYSFDFQGSASTLAASTLSVTAVTVDGAPATFTRVENTTTSNATTDIHKLIVTPATAVSGVFTTVVTYSGAPVRHVDTDGSSEGWNNTVDGATFVNQPVGSMTAFPNNNTPSDKATYTFTVNAPSKLTTSNTATSALPGLRDAAVVSNGELQSKTPSGDGTRTTWVWKQDKPMASELALISVGRYDSYESNIALASGRTLHEWSFIDPSISTTNQNTTQATRAQLKAIVDFLESRYGPYPGNSIGLVTDVVPSAINYALETQDRSFFPSRASIGTTTHEMMHQWFGNSVSPVDWNDIWLNEGPATYSEYQFPYEGTGTSTESTETAIYGEYLAADADDDTFASAPTAAMTEASQLFGDQTYNRGVITLEALRTSIGSENFAVVMKQWQLQNVGKSRRTADFIALAESISGRDLTEFFETWIYTTGKPAWPAKFDLSLAGPVGSVKEGDTLTYTLSSRNTGKVEQTGSVVTVDLSDVLDDAELGALPADTAVEGETLTWSVPDTAVDATSTATFTTTVKPGAVGHTLAASARASTLGSTCVSCATSRVVGVEPFTLAPKPTIAGTAKVDGELTAAAGTWDEGAKLGYQWFAGNQAIVGATGTSYTPSADDAGDRVTVAVTGSKLGYSRLTQTSDPTDPVRDGDLRSTPKPTISGVAQVGVELTAVPGPWDGGTTLAYQWFASGSAIDGATAITYTPGANKAGMPLSVSVTGSKPGYGTVTTFSDATAPVADGDPSSTPKPTIAGSAKVGVELTAGSGGWDQGTELTYRWFVGGVAVAGATTPKFTLMPGAVGLGVVVSVTGTRSGYATISTSSDSTGAVVAGDLALTPKPFVTGKVRVGRTIKATPGPWDSGTALSYQWQRDGKSIRKATKATYTAVSDDYGRSLTVIVTATKAGYTSISKGSDGKKVAAGVQTRHPKTVITGKPTIGRTLTVRAAAYDSGTTVSYTWFANGHKISGKKHSVKVSKSLKGKRITAKVTVRKAGYVTLTSTSAKTAKVK